MTTVPFVGLERDYVENFAEGLNAPAVVIAGNAGRPGGALRSLDGKILWEKVHENHRTQEEAVLSNAILSMLGLCTCRCEYSVGSIEEWFSSNISNEFGLLDPRGTGYQTVQGIDYTDVSLSPEAYSWPLAPGAVTRLTPRNERTRRMFKDIKGKSYRTLMVFTAGPVANNDLGPGNGISLQSSVLRTYSAPAAENYLYYRTAVMYAAYAALMECTHKGAKNVLLPFISGGLYAIRDRVGTKEKAQRLLEQYVLDLDDMVVRGKMPNNARLDIVLKPYFDGVWVVTL